MPHKDPAAAKASKRAYYLAHKEQWAKSAAKRKARLREEASAKKQAALLLPKEIVTRACADCGVDIPKYGLHCKACVAVYQKAYRLANAKRISESKKQWKIANKAHVEAKDRAYALANPDKKAAARKKWVLENPGKDTASKAKNAQERKKRVPTWLSGIRIGRTKNKVVWFCMAC